ENPQQRAAFAASALGKSWKEIAPLLAEGSARIGEMIDRGIALSGNTEEAAKRSDEFNDTMAEFNKHAENFGMAVAIDILPGLTRITKAMNEAAKEGGILHALMVGLGGVLTEVFTPPTSDVAQGHRLKREIDDAQILIDRYTQLAAEIEKAGYPTDVLKEKLKSQLEIRTGLEKELSALQNINAQTGGAPAGKPKTTVPGVAKFIGGAGEDKDESKKIEGMLAREQAKYDKLHLMAVMFDATETERIALKLGFDLEQMDKEHNATLNALDEYTNTEEDKAALEISYQQARFERTQLANDEITRIEKEALDKRDQFEKQAAAEKLKSDQHKMRSEVSLLNFGKLIREKEYSNAMGMAQQLTAGLVSHSRAAFSINKIASISKAVMDTYKGISGVLGEFPGPVGWAMAAV
ncbi:MAG TPA: hypothetical protein VJ521_14740, partial [Acidobacteriota bacterium]|nr:hypothetical protein [Acidobacteriota bacterium]